MQQQVYQVHDVDELKERMIDVWHGFQQCVINVWNYENYETPYIAYFIVPIIFVNFVNTKEEWLKNAKCPKFAQLAITPKRYEMMSVTVITNRKSHTGFQLIPTMTLNGLERRNNPYFAFFPTEFDCFTWLMALRVP